MFMEDIKKELEVYHKLDGYALSVMEKDVKLVIGLVKNTKLPLKN